MGDISDSALPTISSLLQWANRTLKEKGVTSARLDAEVLLGHLLKCPRIELYRNYHCPLKPSILRLFKRLVQKRRNSYPLAYLIGHIEFMSLDFQITPAVMIPRPETELVVEETLRTLRGGTIVEIGTGCGNIVIALAHLARCPKTRFFASDISRAALRLARKNAISHNLTDRITFCYGNLFKTFDHFRLKGKIDLVVSNPPYVSQKEYRQLPLSIRRFEPRSALLAGKTGLEFYKRIITESVTYLRLGGYLVLEMGYNQFESIKELLESAGYFDRINFIKDLQGIKRVISARSKRKE